MNDLEARKNPIIEKPEEELISLFQASRIYGYTQEHLNLLARNGKLKAKKVGRNWHTTTKWMDEFIASLSSASNPASSPMPEDKNGKKAEKFLTHKLPRILFGTAIIILAIFGLSKMIETEGEINTATPLPEIANSKPDFLEKGIVKGETTSMEINNALTSENYKIAEVRFGGDVAIFTTGNQNLKLQILDVRSESFMDNKKSEAKLVISWRTNKLAISEIEYSKNSGQNPKKIKERDYSFDHSAILSGLDPSTTYIYSIKTTDRWGNAENSGYFAAYTGAKIISVFELIAKAMNDTFGWAVQK